MIGCQTININTLNILDKKEHIILGLIWQIIRNQAEAKINLKNNPYLIRLKEEGEEGSDLLKLSPEELLKRWFNYHLKNAGHDRRIKNFTSDLKDAVNYTILLNQLNKNIDKSGLDLTDEQRATKVIKDSKTLNVPNTILAKDILSVKIFMKGNDKLNTLFCAEIFNNCPGLTASEEEYNAAKMLDDDIEGSREERSKFFNERFQNVGKFSWN